MDADARSYRKDLVRWLRPRIDFNVTALGCTLGNWLGPRTDAAKWKDYCNRMSRPAVHLDHIAMFAQGQVQKKNVLIYTDLANEAHPVLFQYEGARANLVFIHTCERDGKPGHYEAGYNVRAHVWQNVIGGVGEEAKAIEILDITVTYRDLRLLRLGTNLSDTVIDAALALMNKAHPEFLFMTTFWYTKWDKTSSADEVRRWWIKAGKKDVQKVFIPVNYQGCTPHHWMGCIFSREEKSCKSTDSIFNDRVHRHVTRQSKALIDAIKDEWKNCPEKWESGRIASVRILFTFSSLMKVP